MELRIRHEEDETGGRYVADLDGSEAVLVYERLDAETLDYRSTRVPPEARRRGIASRLVRHALDDARARGLRVVPTCSFVAAFIERHPEYAALVPATGASPSA